MGLMDKLRAELVDIIEWIDDSRHTLVWRFPWNRATTHSMRCSQRADSHQPNEGNGE